MNAITAQDNQTLEKYITALAAAQNALEAARDQWQDANSAPAGVDGQATLEAAGALDRAVEDYRQAASDLAQHTAAVWRSGYRLCRDE